MTLPVSGLITMNMINVELGKSGTAPINLNSAECRDLADVPSGLITLDDFYGKSNVAYPPITFDFTGVTATTWPTGWSLSGEADKYTIANKLGINVGDDAGANIYFTFATAGYGAHKGGTVTSTWSTGGDWTDRSSATSFTEASNFISWSVEYELSNGDFCSLDNVTITFF